MARDESLACVMFRGPFFDILIQNDTNYFNNCILDSIRLSLVDIYLVVKDYYNCSPSG